MCVLVVSVLQKFHAIRRPIATQLIKIEAVGREATPTEVRRECDARRTRRSSGCITPSILLYRHIRRCCIATVDVKLRTGHFAYTYTQESSEVCCLIDIRKILIEVLVIATR